MSRRLRSAARVVFCSQNLPVPQDPRVWREARALAAAGHDVTVIAPRGRGMAFIERLDGIRMLRYPVPPELPGVAGQALETVNALFWTVVLALSLRLRAQVDVLHAANPPDTFFLVALLLRPLGTRFVYDQHDACPELLEARSGRRALLNRILRFLERRSYAAADLVIAPNNSYRRLALERGRVPEEAVVVVRSGPEEIGSRAGRRESRRPGGPVVAGFAGVMGAQDGVDLLLDAAAEVLADRPGSLEVELIGEGDAVPNLRARAESHGIAESVRFTGWLTGDAFQRRLAALDVAVSPDHDNAFTRVSTMTKVGDYLAQGVPSVVADLPENRATAGDAVLYFQPGDASGLASRLLLLVDEPALMDDLRSRALERAEMLHWRWSAERLVGAYRWLLDDGPAIAGRQSPPGNGQVAGETLPPTPAFPSFHSSSGSMWGPES